MKAAVYSFSARGAQLSKKIGLFLEQLGWQAVVETTAKYAEAAGLGVMTPDYKAACARSFAACDALIFVGAAGIAVRAIAPCVKSKLTDPAVLSVDEQGQFVIPLLAGHIGGANELARILAAHLNAVACVSTATDVNGLFAVDEWAARNNMVIDNMKAAKDFAAALVDGQVCGLHSDFAVAGALPKQIKATDEAEVGMAVTLDRTLAPYPTTVRLLPKIVHLGIGCRRNTPLANIESLVLPELAKMNIDLRTVKSVASVDLKKDEAGLLAFAEKYSWPAVFYTAAELEAVAGDFTPSGFVKSVVGVANVCERSAVKASGGRLLLRKTARGGLGVTLAVAVEEIILDFSRTGLKK